MPRDPERIDAIIEILRATWHKSPDQRLMQLLINGLFITMPSECTSDVSGIYHTEDDFVAQGLGEMLRRFPEGV